MREPVIVIGAGPAGLATAAMLKRKGIDALVLERGTEVGAAWRSRYESLQLHTIRTLSNLPGLALERSAGRFVNRAEFVDYLDRYAAEHRVRVQPSTDVHRIDRSAMGFQITTGTGVIDTAAVVVATGYCRQPVIPPWPGRELYTGRLLHSSEYINADRFRGSRVLVVGAGNSGSDIALDLASGGADTVWVSVRTPPQIVPRQALGLPAQLAGIGLRRAPAAMADTVARLERRIFIGDLTDVGLPAPAEGLFTHFDRVGGLPVLDFGFAGGARRGEFRVVPAVESIEAHRVVLEGGAAVAPDVVVAATGFVPALEPLVGHLGALDSRGLPRAHGGTALPNLPGLWFTGFRNPISGSLRELRFEAPAIADAVAETRR